MLEFFAGWWRRAGRVADQHGLARRRPGFRPPLSPGLGCSRIYRRRRTNSVTHCGIRVRGLVSERELVADHPVVRGQLRVLNFMSCEISRARRPRHNSLAFFLQSALGHCGAGVPPAGYSPTSIRRRISSIITSNSGSPRSESRSVSVSTPRHDQPVSRASWRLARASPRPPSMALMQARL